MYSNWVVLKFGGTSVAQLSCWEKIRKAVEQKFAQGLQPVLVCSAITGITDLLTEISKSPKNYEELIQRIRAKHKTLAESFQLQNYETILAQEFQTLERLALGVSLLGHAHPQTKAQLLSLGEIMLTRLANAYLQKLHIPGAFLDAREHMQTIAEEARPEADLYLNACCPCSADQRLQSFLRSTHPTGYLITQGFIASNEKGETVLLGRGGSDTAAAYFAGKLQARTLEIWTDVPGMFTSNPREISTARLIKELDYEEAKELASSGAKVLHPRCIDPLKEESIPLKIVWTERPEFIGTEIHKKSSTESPNLKAVTAKKGLYLISLDTVNMWQEVGFLCAVFSCFKSHGFSVDLVATSQSNVTLTLDPQDNELLTDRLPALIKELSAFSQVKVVSKLAAVSLVGKNIGALSGRISQALEILSEYKTYLMTQAASNLDFTFLVEETVVFRVVEKIHHLFFSSTTTSHFLGESWMHLFQPEEPKNLPSQAWWQAQKNPLLGLAKEETPLYVYNLAVVEQKFTTLRQIQCVDRIFYAMKANNNPQILQKLESLGSGFDCVSLGEVQHLLKLFPKISPERIIFTPNFAPISEYRHMLEYGSLITLDNLFLLEEHGSLFANQKIILRIDIGAANRGHHPHVQTTGKAAKFGIAYHEVQQVKELVEQYGVHVIGLHAHVGSGIRSPETWAENAMSLLEYAGSFPELRILNLGGGFGVREKLQDVDCDIHEVYSFLTGIKKNYPQYQLWIEPGRFLVSEAGVLLATVTQIKHKSERTYIGVNTGMNSLIRYPLYGAYHEIANLTRLDSPERIQADIVGPLCETGDIFAHNRGVAPSKEGDVMLFANAGAYGKVMSSHYNMREPAREKVIY